MTGHDIRVVITGGTRGLGRHTAARLKGTGASVLITGTTENAVDEVSRKLGVEGMALNLADQASIDRTVARLAARPGPIDCLVANAGVQVVKPAATVDGIELTFAVNHLGHLALIDGLRRAGAMPRRIVLIASATHDPKRIRRFMPHPLPVDVELLRRPPTTPGQECLRRYTTSKLAAIMTCYELARRFPDSHVLAYDPGLMPGTALGRDRPALARFLWSVLGPALTVMPFASSPSNSARILSRFVLGVEDVPNGSHLHFAKIVPSSEASYDKERQRNLYDDSLKFIERRKATA